MTKSCPSCGAGITPEARFCRRCGTPLRGPTDDEGATPVSPLAATIPLKEEGRTTDGLAASDLHTGSPETTRINRADLEAIMRSSRTEQPLQPPSFTSEAATPHFEQPASAEGRPGANSPQTAELDELTLVSPNPAVKTAATTGQYSGPDNDLTIAAPRSERLNSAAPAGPITRETVPPIGVARPAPGARPARGGRWPIYAAISAVALSVVVAAVLLAVRYARRPVTVEPAGVASPMPTSDPRQVFAEKLAEAEAMLASGDMDGAVARLREANNLDPANTKAHWRLGEILLDSGKRAEAIEEFRAVTRNDPGDAAAWRALASAQFNEGRHGEAADAYRRLLALSGEAAQNPNDLLSFADALRLAGRPSEALSVYQKLSSSTAPEVASAARRYIAELGQVASVAASPTPEPSREVRPDAGRNPSETVAAAATPTPASTPTTTSTPSSLTSADRYRRGVELWSSNRAAALVEFRAAAEQGGNPDAYYYLGLSLVEGKDLSKLKRAEVGAALRYFQFAAQRGQFSAQARRYVEQLGKEFDRFRQ